MDKKQEEISYEALAVLEPEARMHPTLGVLVSPNGCVLAPACGRYRARWTYGCTNAHGYKVLHIRGKTYPVHRLVAEAFLGLAPEGKPQVDHIDRNRANNCLENLHWVSAKENALNKANSVQGLIESDPETYCTTSYRRKVGVRLGLIEKMPRGRPLRGYGEILDAAPRAPDGQPIVPPCLAHNARFHRYLREHSIGRVHYGSDPQGEC